MSRKLVLGLFICILSIPAARAQNEIDVVRYLSTSPIGTARYSSMAGAFSALGGDATTLIVNPAGSAIFTKNELSVTPGFTWNDANSEVFGASNQESTSRLILSNIAYVSSSKSNDNKALYATFGLGYSRINDFNRKYGVSFDNDQSSMLFSFTDRAFGVDVNDLSFETPFTSHLAYETYLIDPVEDTPTYYLTNPLYEESFERVGQEVAVEEKGSMNDFHFNFGVGIQEKIFLGATLSFINGNYEQDHRFFERTADDSLLLDEFVFRYQQNTDLNAANLKLGIIIKPEDWLRMSFAYHLPYRLGIRDEFTTYIRSNWKDGEFFEFDSPDGFIDYELRNPGKLILGFALVSKKRGLLSLDLEWLNYGNAEFFSEEFDFSPENRSISESLGQSLTLRAGGEIWVKNFNFRLGYSFRQNPYQNKEIYDVDLYHSFAAGIGILTRNNIFANLSGNYAMDSFVDIPYDVSIAPQIQNSYSDLSILFSAGVRF